MHRYTKGETGSAGALHESQLPESLLNIFHLYPVMNGKMEQSLTDPGQYRGYFIRPVIPELYTIPLIFQKDSGQDRPVVY
jgi:hypothetical protein